MMKKSLVFMLSGALVLLAPLAYSADKESAKIGVVNVGVLLEKSPQAKTANVNIEKEFAPQQQELNRLGKELEQQASNYKKNKMLMKPSQKTAKENEIRLLTREVQRKRNDIQELVNIKRNEELAKLQSLVNIAIKEVGKTQKFDLILYEGIAYTNNRLDVTGDVLNILKKSHASKRTEFNK